MSTTTATLTTAQVADRLVTLCRQGQFVQAIDELYAPNIVSTEPQGAQGDEVVKGIDPVKAKSVEFGKSMQEVHSMKVTDPIVAENFFTVGMYMDITMAGAGRVQMDELCVYEVKDGRIVSDRFFYTPMPTSGQN